MSSQTSVVMVNSVKMVLLTHAEYQRLKSLSDDKHQSRELVQSKTSQQSVESNTQTRTGDSDTSSEPQREKHSWIALT